MEAGGSTDDWLWAEGALRWSGSEWSSCWGKVTRYIITVMCHVNKCNVMSYCYICHAIILCHVKKCYAMSSYYDIFHVIILCHVNKCYVMLSYWDICNINTSVMSLYWDIRDIPQKSGYYRFWNQICMKIDYETSWGTLR